ncbi:hypothetical protein AVEN_616-1 [Araneus ventricosus]|uniref:Uncharacterized protein n=1 Tax=Araneus ventricosus TaxID=182803 RepID=A0A4Y2ELC6_ARAVE|nr:hypothetical protein AVEN_616-1 [Araneus ventricosus]
MDLAHKDHLDLDLRDRPPYGPGPQDPCLQGPTGPGHSGPGSFSDVLSWTWSWDPLDLDHKTVTSKAPQGQTSQGQRSSRCVLSYGLGTKNHMNQDPQRPAPQEPTGPWSQRPGSSVDVLSYDLPQSHLDLNPQDHHLKSPADGPLQGPLSSLYILWTWSTRAIWTFTTKTVTSGPTDGPQDPESSSSIYNITYGHTRPGNSHLDSWTQGPAVTSRPHWTWT